MELRFGWLVEPDIEARSRSTTSTPARAGFNDRRGSDAARVMRVEMDRQADLFLERFHQHVRGVWAAKAGHVLDRQEMRAPSFPIPSPASHNISGEYLERFGSSISPV